jgi:hypothetical protein
MSIKRWIRNWLSSEDSSINKVRLSEVEAPNENGVQIAINNAINGRVLTIRTYQPSKNHNRSDWVTEYYVIKEGESLTEALTMLLMMKGIDK